MRLREIFKSDSMKRSKKREALKKVLHKLEKKREKLPQKINRQIAKKEDRLKFSMQDLLASKWADLAKYAKKKNGGQQSANSKSEDIN